MAISLNSLHSLGLTNIYGRRLTLDPNDYLLGPKDLRLQVQELTSATTNQTLAAYGDTVINVTSAVTTGTNTFIIPNPTPGLSVRYFQGVNGTTSTQGSTAILLERGSTAFTITASEGTTLVGVLLPFGTGVELRGITTALYQVSGRTGLMTVTGTS